MRNGKIKKKKKEEEKINITLIIQNNFVFYIIVNI